MRQPSAASLSADERDCYDELLFVFSKGIGDAFQMGLWPQNPYGLADPPIALASHLLDHNARSYKLIAGTVGVELWVLFDE